MAQRLFSIGKVGVMLESFSGGIEKRTQDPETKVIVLSCSVSPFASKHASAIDNGTKGQQNIRNTIFDNSGNAEPRAGFVGHDFTLGIPRQDFEMFLTPDSQDAHFLLDHVKVRDVAHVKAHKDNPNAMVLTFKAVVGPCSGKELAEIQKWYRTQRFITFQESDPSLEFEEASDAKEDEEEAEPDTAQPALEMADDAAAEPGDNKVESIEPARQRIHSGRTGKKGRPGVH